ncbi:MAG: rhodanese-like domain-containing protein [Bdellovibrionota bacterium]
MRRAEAKINNGVPEVGVEGVFKTLGQVKLIDVRRPDEFNNELGHINGAELVTLGLELTEYLKGHKNKDQEIIFICRSGKRSEAATLEAQQLGFKTVANMIGGMILWNEKTFPTVKE